ncbi:hypothetical protein RR11_488 [Ruegeria sp. R11]|nr:hypothetical protein RR11_488 [Ruegeria sp. R11]
MRDQEREWLAKNGRERRIGTPFSSKKNNMRIRPQPFANKWFIC